MIGTKVLLRVRVGARDARVGGLVDGARILALFSDLASELLIRLDGDEGLFHAYESIEFLASVYAGDFLEATAELVDVGETERRIRFSASKVISHARHPGMAPSAADLLGEPVVVCRATGRCVTPAELQRRPRELYVPQLPPGEPPTPDAVVTPPGDSTALARVENVDVVVTATLAVGGASTRAVGETVEAAVLCREGGASVVHLRSPTEASLVEAAREIARTTGCLVHVGSIGAPAAAGNPIALVSVPCGSANHGDDVTVATRPMIRDLARAAAATSAIVLECREVGHVETALALAEDGSLAEPLRFEVILGAPGSMCATDANLRFLTALVPANAPWTLAATGAGAETTLVLEGALRLGGHVRVGEGAAAEALPELVRRAVGYARAIGRVPADPARARELLSLSPLSHRPEVTRS